MTVKQGVVLATMAFVALGPAAASASAAPPVPGGWKVPEWRSITTKAEAAVVTRKFLATIGVNAKVLRIDAPPASPIFKVKFDARRELWVGKHTGRPVHYWDNVRLGFEGERPLPRNTVFRSKWEARERLWSLARKLGAPPEAKIDSIYTDLGVPGKRSDRCVQAEWVWPLNGLPVFGLSLGMKLYLDPADGVAMGFDATEDVQIAKSVCRISPSEAKEIAVAEAIRDWGGKPGAGEPELGYVLPAGHGGAPFVLRLGWAVPIGGSIAYEVAVDAETGKVLGAKDRANRGPG